MKREQQAVEVDQMSDGMFGEVKIETYRGLLEMRHILINGDINEDIIEKGVIQVLRMSADDEKKPITIILNSGGGSSDGQALVDVIRSIKTPVITVALAKAASAAFDIFLAGDHRIVYQNTVLMCHAGRGHIEDERIPMINDMAAFNAECFKRWASFYADRTNQPYHYWYAILDSAKDFIFFPAKALEYGLVHEVRKHVTEKHPFTPTTLATPRKLKRK